MRMAAFLLLLNCGCSRAFYRSQADRDAYRLIAEKRNPAEWPLENFSIAADPRSRMYDPFSADRPPMPPDDPSSHQFMHRVDGKKGYPGWHAHGDTAEVENPNWQSYLPTNEQNKVVLNADRAVSLALLHSPAFQRELEELYLSALDVSFERFRFDHQFFAGYSAMYTADGRLRNGNGESSSLLNLSTFPGSRGVRMRKFSTTGAELLVGFANSLVWQFAGPNDYDPHTLLDFSLIQPLLRNAGRDRILEGLTFSERALLANVRQMERFRSGFYLQVFAGMNPGIGPSRGGISLGSLNGFSGVGDASGFLGLLQDRLNIRNQEANIASLRSSLAQLQAFFEAGRIDYLQMEQARQALFNAESRLLSLRAAYFTRLDTFKLNLGLPPQVPVEVSDPLLDGFDLIDPATVPLQNELTQIQEQVGRILAQLAPSELGKPDNANPANVATERPREELLEELRQWLKKAESLRDQLETTLAVRAANDIERLRNSIPDRRDQWQALRRQLTSDDELGNTEMSSTQLVAEDQLRQMPEELSQSLQATLARLRDEKISLANIDQHLAELHDGWSAGNAPSQAASQAVLRELPNELTILTSNSLDLALTQARARTESLTLVPIQLDWKEALETARRFRLDWMNARAALVDAWRLIEFHADDLESDLDLVFSGDISNVGNNPFRFRDTTGRLRVGVQFDAPITRLSERNTYRQALIEYQRARRRYYRYQDEVAAGLRSSLRTIRVNQMNFELRRAAVQVAITQVELTRLRLQEPPRPNQEFSFGATTARDLVSALTDLLSVQNDFLTVWVSHEVLRRSLDFHLGTMQLDESGRWIDPGPILDEPLTEELPAPPPPLPAPDGETQASGLPRLIVQATAGAGQRLEIERLPVPPTESVQRNAN